MNKTQSYFPAQILTVAQTNQLAALTQYGQLKNVLLGKLTGANFNVTTDQAITINNTTRYIIRSIVVTNASISLDTALGGIYAAASKTTALVAAGQAYSALTAAAKYLDLTLEAIVSTDTRTQTTLYLSLSTPQGAAATADVYVFGDIISQ